MGEVNRRTGAPADGDDELRLNGRAALITGSGSGIGKAIALRFAREGCKAAVSDVDGDAAANTANEIGALGHQAVPIEMDVADEASVLSGVAIASSTLGPISILVNVAGIWAGGSVTEVAVADWDRVIAVNLRGPFLCSRAVLPSMVERSFGVILNVASITAARVTKRAGAYNPSKAGLIALTKTMALDYAAHQIRVNAICPGGITGTQMEAVAERFRGGTPEEARERNRSMYPLGRRGTPDEIAAAALYLASDEARWVTGSCLVIDGGASAGFWAV